MTNTDKTVIAFDADDTLWPNEHYFREGEQQIIKLLERYYPGEDLLDKLYQQEIKNLHVFGYGAKGFALSMIESLIELSDGKVTGQEIQQVIEIGKMIMSSPIELISGVTETIEALRGYPLMIITKGDLFDQESKIARSGLADNFKMIEIVSEKDDATYLRLLKKYHIAPENFWMVGNSLKSDILPVAHIGAHAVHIPHETTWVHEMVSDKHASAYNYHELSTISELPALIKREVEREIQKNRSVS